MPLVEAYGMEFEATIKVECFGIELEVSDGVECLGIELELAQDGIFVLGPGPVRMGQYSVMNISQE